MTRTTPELTSPSKPPNHTNRRKFGHNVGSNVHRPTYMTDLKWNRISNLEPSYPKAEILPLSSIFCLSRGKTGRMATLSFGDVS
ncbi:hypothetical protein AVEN_70594-1 [Araneus ventricosus]|uniref:Uncharacterized protein n=1 Tax=Araneus ventricosus TaxID=182803 RepID=A0A4Y2CGU5_ARAVE|nr:hypothetical protein AVEN_70594-1 [Araneus ventricosus]